MVYGNIPHLWVHPDTFLYACWEAEKARTFEGRAFNSHLRYEPFLFETYTLPSDRSLDMFLQEARAIFEHQKKVSPQFRRREDVTLDTISFFTLAAVTLYADFTQLLYAYTGCLMPSLPKIPPLPGYKALAEAINSLYTYEQKLKEYRDTEPPPFDPFIEVSPENFAADVWDVFRRLMRDVFEDYAEIMGMYAIWKHTEKESETQVAINWSKRPPVGKAFMDWLKSIEQSRDSENSYGNSESKLVRGSALHSKNNGKHASKAKTDNDGHADSTQGGDYSAKSHKGKGYSRYSSVEDSDEYIGDSSRRASTFQNAYSSSGTTEDQLRLALEEVDRAVDLLRSDASLKEVALPPANSYIRHRQHVYACEQGFVTESRGEKRERCVFIKRPNE